MLTLLQTLVVRIPKVLNLSGCEPLVGAPSHHQGRSQKAVMCTPLNGKIRRASMNRLVGNTRGITNHAAVARLRPAQPIRRPGVQAQASKSSPQPFGQSLADQVLLVVAGVSLASPAWAQEAAAAVPKRDNGFLNPIVDSLDYVLGNIESFYLGIDVPYAYGWSIVSLTLFVKTLTLPLTKKQVESAMAVQNLKPRIDVIKERYGDDKDKIQKETSRLYEQAEVNPLAGCGPSLLQLPIFIGLFRSLNNVASSGTLDNEGFYWVPSLAGAPLDSVSVVRSAAFAQKRSAAHRPSNRATRLQARCQLLQP